jgi:hypothetical protein
MGCQFHRFLAVMCVLAGGVTSGFLAAQQSPQPPPSANSGIAAGIVAGPRLSGVQGLPYSAEEVTVTTQTLADGTIITHQRRVKLYRDSEGRTRRESFGSQAASGESDDTPLNVHIVDPVAGVTYELNPRNHTARKIDLPHPTPSTPGQTTNTSVNLTPASPNLPRATAYEDLGTQVVEGLEVRGSRTTTTVPAGAQGNDRPIESTRESWYSSELRLVVMTATKDPRFGETVMKLNNLVRDEPPADLFQVPPDYTLEEVQPAVKPVSGLE